MRRFFNDRFFINSLIVFAGSFLVSVLSYVYYPVLARLMNFSDFGEVQTIVSIFTQASLIFSAINIVTVILISNDSKEKKSEHFIVELQKLMVYFVLFIGVVAAAASTLLRNFFNFESVWPFLAMVLALLLNVPLVFWSSYLQGQEKFMGMNLLGVLGAGGKLIASAGLVLIGWGSFGAVLGLFLGQLFALAVIGRHYELPSLRSILDLSLPRWRVLKVELGYTGLVFFVTLMVTFLYSGDILLVKHYQNPASAGAYAGIASVARIVFFLTLPFATVLLPALQRSANRLATLRKSMILLVGLGSITCLVFWVFSRQLVGLLIGQRYEQYASLLPELSVAILLISISNLLVYYLLALKSLMSLPVATLGLAIFLSLSFHRHGSLQDIVHNLAVASAVTLVMLVLTITVWLRVRARTLFPRFMTMIKGDDFV